MDKKFKEDNLPLILLILDGLAIAPEGDGNAVSKARMPFLLESIKKYPSVVLKSAIDKNAVDQSQAYSILGMKPASAKSSLSLTKTLNENNVKWCLLAEPDRATLSCEFFLGEKPLSLDDIFLAENEDQDDTKLKDFAIISNELIKRIKSNKQQVIFVFSSCLELIARQGDILQTIQALEEVDRHLSKICKAILEKDGTLLISSTSGQAEAMIDVKTDKVNKGPSNNDLPLVVINKELEGKTMGFPEAPNGDLSTCQAIGSTQDIPPTILSLLGIKIAGKKSGKPLL